MAAGVLRIDWDAAQLGVVLTFEERRSLHDVHLLAFCLVRQLVGIQDCRYSEGTLAQLAM